MKLQPCVLFLATILILFSFSASAATLYVDLNSVNPTLPYATWSTAATNIQDAVDAANTGDQIWVNDGIYQAGGRVIYGALTNRVAIDKGVTVQSVNGPSVTVIKGHQDINSVEGDDAIRCVYLANNAVLSGFTLTNAATRATGDTNLEQSGSGIWCESTNGIVTNCIITGCSANNLGGGVFNGTLYNCIITNDTAGNGGGGAYEAVLNQSIVISCLGRNYGASGGGVGNSILIGSTVSNCKIGNGGTGGGVINSFLNRCFIASNSVSLGTGGGVADSTLNNCILFTNSSPWSYGGGAESCTLNNCTLVNNFSDGDDGGRGGGADASTLNNCILYYNITEINIYNNGAGDNYNNCILNNCCTIPLPASGAGNITNVPVFVNLTANDFHLQSDSPCINSGDNFYVSVTNDFDGNPRISGGTVDMGAYEYQNPSSVLSYAWAQQYGLPTDGSADYLDLDGTGMSNLQKSIAGLNPTNPASVLAMNAPTNTNNDSGITVTWQSVTNRYYFLQSSTNLAGSPAFITIQSNLLGQADTTSYNDTSATNAVPYFYRIGVQ